MVNINFQQASAAYKAATQIANNASSSVNNSENNIQSNFGNILNSTLTNSINNLKQAENLSTSAIIGKADITDVVTSVANAELTLQAIVAVRDKLVNAHQDIIKMPI